MGKFHFETGIKMDRTQQKNPCVFCFVNRRLQMGSPSAGSS